MFIADPRLAVAAIAAALDWGGAATPEVDWGVVERRLGTLLPGDYKEFMARFPSGMFRSVIRFINPTQTKMHLRSFQQDFDQALANVRTAWEYDYDTYLPFPEPGGVIPFASDDTGGVFFRLPWTPDPDRWHVVYLSRHSPDDWTRMKRSMTAVMLELAKSQGKRNILGWDMSRYERSFQPH
ncbi:SMI1/KNR4 family protein [Amycolatopsis decaplanina]|uniref:SMI1/KNR4 family protein n=1 Tax=Amycolatopsis decaplanina TaxID=208441 RepID=UPI00126798F7|nr:SMI1/KNR4 family protein [Amycolatopsis decaplanina]